MSTKFHHSVRREGDITWVILGGVIDEDNELGALNDQIDSPDVVIDVGGVERINSCGVRDWVNWLGGIESRPSRVVLVRCSPAIVAQINLVSNFAGGSFVKSFYIPYFCSECDQEKVMLSEAAELGEAPHQPPVCRCDECDLVMEFDDMADSYFAFLAHQPAGTPIDLAGVIARADRSDGSSDRIRTRSPSVPPPVSSGGSLPSIPSLPTGSGAGFAPTRPPAPPPFAVPAKPPGSNTLIYAVLVAAIVGVAGLIYALTT